MHDQLPWPQLRCLGDKLPDARSCAILNGATPVAIRRVGPYETEPRLLFVWGERRSLVTSQTVWAFAGERTDLRLAC